MAEELDREKRFPYEIVAKLGELGLMGMPYPEEYGGGGADTLTYAIAIEELARVDSSRGDHGGRAHLARHVPLVHVRVTDEQKEEWLPRLCAGERLGAFGLTEPEAGSDAGNTRTTAELDGRRLGHQRREAVHHQRRHRHLGLRDDHRAHRATATRSRTSSSRPARRATTTGEPYRKMGWNASDTRPLAFEDCRVPEDEPARPARRRASSSSCTSSTAAGSASPRWASGSRRARSTRRSRTRRSGMAFGQPISKYQAIQAKLADMSTEIEAARPADLQGGAREGRRPNFRSPRRRRS